MNLIDWLNVDESTGGFDKLPAGGYVVKIVSVEDNASRQYLDIVWDIVEGEHAGHYSDEWGKKNPWAHHTCRSYKETARGMFKHFLACLERSNPAFSIEKWQGTSNEQALIGLVFGAVVQYEDYTNGLGDDKERLNVEVIKDADEIRKGDFTVPERKDSRDKAAVEAAPAAASADALGLHEELPF